MPGDTIDEIMENSSEEENKIDVEKTTINLGCVKNEVEVKFEENLHVTQYRINPENIFSVTSLERNFHTLVGFSDNDAIMENVIIKLEDIRQEDGNFSYCSKCKGDYKGYCLKCSTLSHILNPSSPYTSSNSEINTIPNDILEIRNFSGKMGVFLLKTVPKNVIFGPFEGLLTIETEKGFGWKMNDKKLENVETGNWMKFIGGATSALIKNLDVFQMKESLYFQTSREIKEGEELLVCYDDENVQELNDGGNYFIPQKLENLPKIFACTLCCLGFQLVKCLMEHKSKCPHVEQKVDIKDFELVECHCCKIWLEKKEDEEYHMGYCWEKHLRLSYGHSQSVDRNEINVEVEDCPDIQAVGSRFKCSQCLFESKYKGNLRRHLNTHKKYQCSECLYKTNYKILYKSHLHVHTDIKKLECGICKMKFTAKSSVKCHMRIMHREIGSAKDHQCPECSYQTNYKHHFDNHRKKHAGITPFECSLCEMKFVSKSELTKHVKDKHAENHYKCSECAFETNHKGNLQVHLNHHSKPFECHACKTKFANKTGLKMHIRNKHPANGSVKDYQCSECSYQTNYKYIFQTHRNAHRGIKPVKPFKCDSCHMKFTLKTGLKTHIKNRHAKNGSAKDYKCTECSYQTNYKHVFESHQNRHRGIKPFECGVCKKRFTLKNGLKVHMWIQHTATK